MKLIGLLPVGSAWPARLVDRHRGLGDIVGDRVIGAGGGGVVVAGRIGGNARVNRGDHVSVAGHATDGHIIGGAIHRRDLGDDAGQRARRTAGAQVYIAGGEGADRFAKDDDEVDRADVGRVGLANGLVDRDRRRGVIQRIFFVDGRIADGRAGCPPGR